MAQVRTGAPKIDMLHWISRAALEYIGQAGMGYSFDSLDPQGNIQNQYTKAVKNFASVYFVSLIPLVGN